MWRQDPFILLLMRTVWERVAVFFWLNLRQYYQSGSCVRVASIPLIRVRCEPSNQGKGIGNIHCIHTEAARIFNRKLWNLKPTKCKISVSGEIPTTFELHCYSQGHPGCGAKCGVISVSSSPPGYFSRSRSREFIHSCSLPQWQVLYSVLFWSTGLGVAVRKIHLNMPVLV